MTVPDQAGAVQRGPEASLSQGVAIYAPRQRVQTGDGCKPAARLRPGDRLQGGGLPVLWVAVGAQVHVFFGHRPADGNDLPCIGTVSADTGKLTFSRSSLPGLVCASPTH